MEVCVKYLDTNPLKSSKAHPGDLDIPVTFGGVTFTPGEYVYGDEDGVVISPTKLSL
jgi:regulator of ribonuclease activity A